MLHLTIGKLAQQTGISKVAIRYYERIGLLPKVIRQDSGYRLYSQSAIDCIHFIKNAKSVGFTLDEIGELLALEQLTQTTSHQIKLHTLAKLKAIQEKIATLQHMADSLTALMISCDGKMPLQECPILKALHSGAMPACASSADSLK